MSPEARDFSDFVDEVESQETIPVKWKSHTWEIPRPSALQELRVERANMAAYDLQVRASIDPDEVIPDEEMIEYRRAMANSNWMLQMEMLLGGTEDPDDNEARADGRQQIEEMLGTGMPLEVLRGIFRYVFGIDKSSGEGPARANRAARRAKPKSSPRKATRTRKPAGSSRTGR